MHPTTTKEMWSEYVRENDYLWESSTCDSKEMVMRYWLEANGDLRPDDIMPRHANIFVAHLANKGLSPVSMNSYVKMIKPLFIWAKRNKFAINAFDGLRQVKVPKKEISTFSEAELQAMLEAASPDKRWTAVLLAAAGSGLRKGEIFNLRRGDLDYENGRVMVRPRNDGPWAFVPKDKDFRVTPLSAQLQQHMGDLLSVLPDDQVLPFLSPRRYRYCINLHKTGDLKDVTRKCPDDFRKPWFQILAIAGVPYRPFKALRATAITRWTQTCKSPQDAQALAGHSNIDTTMRYYAATSKDYVEQARENSIV